MLTQLVAPGSALLPECMDDKKAVTRIAAKIRQIKGVNSVKRFEGGTYVVDDCSDNVGFMGAWTGQQLHHGRVHPYPAGVGYYRDTAQRHSGTQSFVTCEKKQSG